MSSLDSSTVALEDLAVSPHAPIMQPPDLPTQPSTNLCTQRFKLHPTLSILALMPGRLQYWCGQTFRQAERESLGAMVQPPFSKKKETKETSQEQGLAPPNREKLHRQRQQHPTVVRQRRGRERVRTASPRAARPSGALGSGLGGTGKAFVDADLHYCGRYRSY